MYRKERMHIYFRNADAIRQILKRSFTWGLRVLIITSLGTSFLPNTKEAAAIYLLPRVVNSEAVVEAEKIPANLAKILNAKMSSWLEDIEVNPKSVQEGTK